MLKLTDRQGGCESHRPNLEWGDDAEAYLNKLNLMLEGNGTASCLLALTENLRFFVGICAIVRQRGAKLHAAYAATEQPIAMAVLERDKPLLMRSFLTSGVN